MKETRELIENCSHFYYNLHLMPDLVNKEVPISCKKYNAVYNLMHYILDISFIPPKVSFTVVKQFYFNTNYVFACV